MIEFMKNFPQLFMKTSRQVMVISLNTAFILAVILSVRYCRKYKKSFLQGVILFLGLFTSIVIVVFGSVCRQIFACFAVLFCPVFRRPAPLREIDDFFSKNRLFSHAALFLRLTINGVDPLNSHNWKTSGKSTGISTSERETPKVFRDHFGQVIASGDILRNKFVPDITVLTIDDQGSLGYAESHSNETCSLGELDLNDWYIFGPPNRREMTLRCIAEQTIVPGKWLVTCGAEYSNILLPKYQFTDLLPLRVFDTKEAAVALIEESIAAKNYPCRLLNSSPDDQKKLSYLVTVGDHLAIGVFVILLTDENIEMYRNGYVADAMRNLEFRDFIESL